MILNLYKQRGETPLECIKRFAKVFAKTNPESIGQKMTYMGRLDPLAEGVLLVATGEDVKRKEEFLELDKDYDFVSLFGFATDSYDILGKITQSEKLPELSETEVRKVAAVYEGEREQKYPLYSSKMIAKKGRGEDEEIPSKKITIHKIKFHGLDTLNGKELFGRLLMDISRVKGDFRQTEILTLWRKMIFKLVSSEQDKLKFFLGRFSASVSSGTYIRSLVNDIGNTLGCGATTLSIRRTRVGDYSIKDSLK
jgi:tRNA pseudouridine55 synthase